MLKLKKWRRVTHEGTGISCEVGRLLYSQKPLLVAMIADVFGAVSELRDEDGNPKKSATMAETTVVLRNAFAKLDGEMVERLFRDRVRDVEGLETEDGPVTSGLDLLALADDELVMWVLGEITKNSDLAENQGKALGSPSISSSEPTLDSDSPVKPIVNADGPSLSTVGETPVGTASSSQVA